MDNNAEIKAAFTTLQLFFKLNKFKLEDEKQLQSQIEKKFEVDGVPFEREKAFDKKNIVDFFVDGTIAVEIKIGSSKMSIYRQCERYCTFPEVKALLLVTNKSMTLPELVNGKPCIVLNLSEAWL
jgi:hypothetical protein